LPGFQLRPNIALRLYALPDTRVQAKRVLRVVPRLRLHQDPASLDLYDHLAASAYYERFSSLPGHDDLMLPAHSNNRAQASLRVTILYALYNIAFALPGTN